MKNEDTIVLAAAGLIALWFLTKEAEKQLTGATPKAVGEGAGQIVGGVVTGSLGTVFDFGKDLGQQVSNSLSGLTSRVSVSAPEAPQLVGIDIIGTGQSLRNPAVSSFPDLTVWRALGFPNPFKLTGLIPTYA